MNVREMCEREYQREISNGPQQMHAQAFDNYSAKKVDDASSTP